MRKYGTDSFARDLRQFNLILSEKQMDQFLRYYEMLVERNRVMNLTAVTEYEDVVKKHFVDSLSLAKVLNLSEEKNVIDVGTGAGFPGLALKIAFPELSVVLLDSLGKRVRFLEDVIQALGLEKIKAVHGRAEDFARKEEFREGFDLCVSRAVANLSTLSEYCIPFVKIGGCFVSYKSERVSQELIQAERALSLLGGVVEEQVEFTLPNSDLYRCLVVIRKSYVTSGKYPRKAGLPSKNPL